MADVILGIAGHVGAGKDTVAAYLVARHGFVRRGFSYALKDEVVRILPRTLRAYVETTFAPAVIAAVGMDALIERVLWHERTPVTRALLQEWGTELRRHEHPGYWVDALAQWVDAHPEHQRIVVPDVRFPDEATMLRRRGALLLRVDRPGAEGDRHASETALRDWTAWDAVFVNDGTVDELQSAVEAWWDAHSKSTASSLPDRRPSASGGPR